jgi:hypothetical protein
VSAAFPHIYVVQNEESFKKFPEGTSPLKNDSELMAQKTGLTDVNKDSAFKFISHKNSGLNIMFITTARSPNNFTCKHVWPKIPIS